MADTSQIDLQSLAEENARLRGEVLATGIILAQLLQSIAKTQHSPHAFVTKIMSNAQKAVEAFNEPGDTMSHAAARKSALETIKNYDEQIRSVLPI